MDTIYLPDGARQVNAAIRSLREHSALKAVTREGVENMCPVLIFDWPYRSTGQDALWRTALSMKGHGSVNLLEVFRVIGEDSKLALSHALAIFAGVREVTA